MVRAKFRVDAIERTKQGSEELHTVRMSPVYGNNDPEHENTKFWRATPSGTLQMGTINKAAAEQFDLGGEYYIDFTKA
jgi:hypothetical protein